MASEDALEFDGIGLENMGALSGGRLKAGLKALIFKSSRTGKMETVAADAIDSLRWVTVARKPALRVIAGENCFRFVGFKNDDFEKIKRFAEKNWATTVEKLDQSGKGWNYGRVDFDGPVLNFKVDGMSGFDVPLQNVSNCTTAKNEVALEFHQNEDCPVSLLEMRFHIPPESGMDADTDQLEEFRSNVMRYAGVEQESDKPLATLENIPCLTPRGRYELKMFSNYLSFHGKSFDYKIPTKSIVRLFLLSHKDGQRMYFVMNIDPAIRQGQTRYNFIVMELPKDDKVENMELGLTEEQLKERYGNKLQKSVLSGPVYEVLSRLMRALVNQRITVPGSFVGHSGTPAISCAYKSTSGFLYPLEKGFIYVYKPPIYIRLEEIACVNFARSDVSTKSFDFEIEAKAPSEAVYIFTSVEKDEYTRLYDFVSKKHLRIRNAKNMAAPVRIDSFMPSDAEDSDEMDHYKERLKNEAREQAVDESDSEEGDSDFDPEKEEARQKAKKEAERAEGGSGSGSDSESSKSSSGESGSGSSKAESESGEEKEKSPSPKKKKPKVAQEKKDKPASSKAVPAKGKPRKKRAKKDPNAPKKAQSAYFLWFNANRKELSQGLSLTETAKKAGATWKTVDAEEKAKWQKAADEDKERYKKEMAEYESKKPSTSDEKKKEEPASSSANSSSDSE